MIINTDELTKLVMVDYETGRVDVVHLLAEDLDDLIVRARRAHDGGDTTVLITSVASRDIAPVSITPELADQIREAAFRAKPHPSL